MRTSRGACVALVTLATFTDIVAYSIAVPVLPDMSRRLGATPTTIGLLFASFGVTLLIVSIPMGAISDRIGRKRPMLIGLAGLSASTLAFAYADRLTWLFAARLIQGAADAVTWVVGLALIADLYGATERGRMTGFVMSGTSLSFMIGPSLGGWLYEIGGIRLPFLAVAALSFVTFAAWTAVKLPPAASSSADATSVADLVRAPGMPSCVAAVVVAASTLSMIEPIGSLHLGALAITPARVGIIFGVAALTNTFLHPIYGRLSDRFGARTMTLVGLIVAALALPLFGLTWSFTSALFLFVLQAAAMSLPITPSLAFMAETASRAQGEAYGVAYGLYNVAWALGLLVGPAIGGFAYERLGFFPLTLIWAPSVVAITLVIARSGRRSAAVPAV